MSATSSEIAFRYRSQDSETGVTRTTAKRRQIPNLGTLHPSTVRIAAAAFAATGN